MQVLDKDLSDNTTREKQLDKILEFKDLVPICKEEYIKVPLDVDWNELEKDVPLAFEKFGWYGMIHRSMTTWDRSPYYGGLGLTFNPDYLFDIPKHAQGYGQPRSTQKQDDAEAWIRSLDKADYKEHGGNDLPRGKNTYDDCLGLRERTEASYFRSFNTIFDKLKVDTVQGRIAEVRAGDLGDHPNKEFIWHRDEKNIFVSRLLIPLVYSEDYFIEFKDTGTKFYFEPGYAYHFNTYNIHRWNFNYHKNIKNRTCMVLGFLPWLSYKDNVWSTNEYFNKIHPTDMIKEGLVI